jgi:hypothetical protein
MGVTSTKSGRLEVNLSLSGKRGHPRWVDSFGKEKKNYAGSENHSPHEDKEKEATLIPNTVKFLFP